MEENLVEEETTDIFSDVTPKVGNSSTSNINEIVDILKPHEVRWFYSSPKKTWIPFLGYDSYRIEIAYRQIHSSLKGLHTDTFDTISVRGDLYEVDVVNKKCSPIYWNGDNVDVMRGTWFFDVGWQPLDEEYASQIESEHLAKFAGWKVKDLEGPLIPSNIPIRNGMTNDERRDSTMFMKPQRTKASLPINILSDHDSKHAHKIQLKNINSNFSLFSTSLSHEDIAKSGTVESDKGLKKTPNGFLPSTNPPPPIPNAIQMSLHPTSPTLTKCATVDGGNSSPMDKNLQESPKGTKEPTTPSKPMPTSNNVNNKKKGTYAIPIHTLKFKDFFVEWYNPSEAYMFSQATSSKLYRSLTYALGFQKMGLRLNRGYCIAANDNDKPPLIKHLVFVIHGIGAKLDASKCIRNCGLLRDHAGRLKQKCFTDKSVVDCRAEFLPIEWRANLKLDDGAVDMISPKNVIGLRSILNTTVMDIMYYTSPIFRNEILNGVQKELNRLYQMFCDRHPEFGKTPDAKVSIIAHSLGTVIIHDILSGWNPSYIHQNYVDQTLNECFEGLNEEESQRLSKFADNIRANVIDIEKKLHLIRKTRSTLKFQVENLFLLGSPLAVFLVMRGISIYGRGVSSANASSSTPNATTTSQQPQMAPSASLFSSSSSSSKTGDEDYDNITNILRRNAGTRQRKHSSIPRDSRSSAMEPPTESLQRELEKIDKKVPPPRPPPLCAPKSASNTQLRYTGDTPQIDGQGQSPSFDKPKISVLLPKHICSKIYNIYHPADPVAYRLEPLISYKYINIKPIPIYRYDLSKKTPYSQLKPELYPEIPDPIVTGTNPSTSDPAEPKPGVSSGEEAIHTLNEAALGGEDNVRSPTNNYSYYDYRSYYPKMLMGAARDMDAIKTAEAEPGAATVVSDSERDSFAYKVTDQQAPTSTFTTAPRSSWTPNLDFIKTYWRRGESLTDQASKSSSKNDLDSEPNSSAVDALRKASIVLAGAKSGNEEITNEEILTSDGLRNGPRFKINFHRRTSKKNAPRKRDLVGMHEKRLASPSDTSSGTNEDDTVDFLIEDINYGSGQTSPEVPGVVISAEQKTIFPLTATTPSNATTGPGHSRSKSDTKANKTQQPSASLGPKEGDIPVLEYRVDYSLPSGWTIVNTYVSAITAHTSYWNNPDVIYFILQHLYNSNL